MNSPRVLIAGPATWNSIVVLDHLPEPVSHMQFAEVAWSTVGGTSAGKALSLTAAGVDALLYAFVGDDEAGGRVRAAIEGARVPVRWGASTDTERHINLMTRAGERVSLFISTVSPRASGLPQDVRTALTDAEIVVLDLASTSLDLLPLAQDAGRRVWVDVHDYDGTAEFHTPFLAAAEAVFCNADRLDDPVAFLRSRVDAGASFGVCTLGAKGAVAVDSAGRVHRVAAAPVDVIDTNGAGDGFFAGVLGATLAGADLPAAMSAGAVSAAAVLRSRHLHPVLDDVLGA
jgi:sugar/nucleoside kinase (ribokinase family)